MIILLIGAMIPCAVSGQAFKNSENDPLSFLRTLPKPNMLIISDTSGSMLFHNTAGDVTVRDTTRNNYINTYNIDSDNLNSRFKNLKNAISAVVSSVGGINYGLAKFNNQTNWYQYSSTFSHTFTSAKTLFKYCYWQDYKTGTWDLSDCILLDKCYLSGWQSGLIWSNSVPIGLPVDGGSYDTKQCVSHTPSTPYWRWVYSSTGSYRDYSSQYNRAVIVNNKHYYYYSNVNATIGSTYDVTARLAKEYDPTDNNPPYLGASFIESYTYDGVARNLTWQIADSYVNYSNVCNGLYMTGSAGNRKVSVDIRNDYSDDPLTPQDEADNSTQLLKATGEWWQEGALIPGGNTPLYSSLVNAQSYFADTIIPRDNSYPEIKACRKNYIVLITDGDETCYPTSSPSSTYFPKKAGDLYLNNNIKTFAIALSQASTTYIDQCADYGDNGYNDGTTPHAYTATNTADIVDAFKDIVSKISDQMDSLAPPVVSTVYTHPYWDVDPSYAGELDTSEAILVMPFFQYPSWRGHLLATWLYYIEYNSRIPDDPATTEDERWLTYNFNPQDMWTAGYILSRQNAPLADTNADTYINELDDAVANSGYKAADSRVLYTTSGNTGTINLIPFNTSLPSKETRLGLADASIPAVILPAWNADKTRRQYVDNNELADVVINYIRGKQPIVDVADSDADGKLMDFKRDPISGSLLYAEKTWKLGDSVLSVPGIISEPSGVYKKKFFSAEYILPTEQTFEKFTEQYVNRPNIVLYGASDGLLHCFALKDISSSTTFGPLGAYSPTKDYIAGEEIWAFVPGDPDVMQKLKWLLMDYNGDGEIDSQLYAQRQSWRDATKYEWMHWYYLDGPVRFSNVFIDEDSDGIREWKTVAIIGEGRGGRYYYAFDFTNPFQPRLMWKFPSDDAGSTNMGVTLSTPAIAYQSIPSGGGYRWLAIFGAGYDPEDNAANDVGQYIYAVDMADGSLVYSFGEPGATDTGVKKAMVTASPAVFNSQAGTDYIDDKAFVGDTDGRLWRIDLHNEVISKRLAFNDEKLAIVTGVSAAHAAGESVWWDIVFVGTGGDTRVTDTMKHRLVGFIDEAFNLPYSPLYATISPSETGDNNLPAPIALGDPLDAFVPTPYVFMHIETGTNERLDAQPTTNVMETATYSKLQSFFTLFNPGANPCVIGTSKLVEVDHYIDKNAGTLERVALPSGSAIGSLDLGEGKSGGTYISDGVVFAPSGSNLNIFGKPVPPPAPKGNKVVVNVLSWKVLSD